MLQLHLASPQQDVHYVRCLLRGAVNGLTAGLLPQVVWGPRDKPKGFRCHGYLSTTTISAIIKEQLFFNLAWIKRWRTELSCGAVRVTEIHCRERLRNCGEEMLWYQAESAIIETKGSPSRVLGGFPKRPNLSVQRQRLHVTLLTDLYLPQPLIPIETPADSHHYHRK